MYPELGRLDRVWNINGRPNLALHLAMVGRMLDRHGTKLLAQYDLNLARWRTIALLALSDRSTFGDLADYSWSDRGDLSRALRRLEQDGLVLRQNNPDDRRSFHFSLTEEGRRIYGAFSADWKGVERELESLFDEADLAAINDGLAKLAGKCLTMMEQVDAD